MHIYIVGKGKLACELLSGLPPLLSQPVQPWPPAASTSAPAIVIHAGSGRNLPEVMAHCRATQSVLVELSTGSAVEQGEPGFPVVLCPNTHILMLKFMHMLAHSGALFKDCRITITESHQADKTSTPGTAVAMAESLGLSASDIVSVRDPEVQARDLHIPEAHLGRHAFHRITLEDQGCHITLEARLHGATPYADGVARIVAAILQHPLAPGVHAVQTFVAKGWL